MEVKDHSFKGWYSRDAFVVDDKVVYFGFHSSKETLVFEKKQSELKVVRQDDDITFTTYSFMSSKTYENGIYKTEYQSGFKVHHYSLKTAKWSLFFPPPS